MTRIRYPEPGWNCSCMGGTSFSQRHIEQSKISILGMLAEMDLPPVTMPNGVPRLHEDFRFIFYYVDNLSTYEVRWRRIRGECQCEK